MATIVIDMSYVHAEPLYGTLGNYSFPASYAEMLYCFSRCLSSHPNNGTYVVHLLNSRHNTRIHTHNVELGLVTRFTPRTYFMCTLLVQCIRSIGQRERERGGD